jgi:RNA polymerase sigma factor (sigma-70 family)
MTNPEWSRQVGTWAEEWHGDLVQFLIRRTNMPADAQDLAQEVYLRLLRADRLDLIHQPRSYLLRIAANVLYEWRLKARRSQSVPDEYFDDLPSADNPEHGTATVQRNRRLSDELSRLPPAARIALVLHVRDGLSYEQIGARMHVTRRMIKRYLHVAYARLRTRVPLDL